MKNSIFINLINTDCLISASSLSGRNKSFEPGVMQGGGKNWQYSRGTKSTKNPKSKSTNVTFQKIQRLNI